MFKTKILFSIITIVLFQRYIPAVFAQSNTEKGNVVAIVLSEKIFAGELEPTGNLKQHLVGLSKEEYDARSQEIRLAMLKARITQPLMKIFCQDHQCEPAADEIAVFHKAMQSFPDQDKSAASLTKEQREKAEEVKRNKEHGMVYMWKFNKALYGAYAGGLRLRYIGLEPIGAYKKWLRENEANNKFQILDPKLKAKFWEYFENAGSHVMSSEDIDKFCKDNGMKHPFDKPVRLIVKGTPKG